MKRPIYDPEKEPLTQFLVRQDKYINYLESQKEFPSEEQMQIIAQYGFLAGMSCERNSGEQHYQFPVWFGRFKEELKEKLSKR